MLEPWCTQSGHGKKCQSLWTEVPKKDSLAWNLAHNLAAKHQKAWKQLVGKTCRKKSCGHGSTSRITPCAADARPVWLSLAKGRARDVLRKSNTWLEPSRTLACYLFPTDNHFASPVTTSLPTTRRVNSQLQGRSREQLETPDPIHSCQQVATTPNNSRGKQNWEANVASSGGNLSSLGSRHVAGL